MSLPLTRSTACSTPLGSTSSSVSLARVIESASGKTIRQLAIGPLRVLDHLGFDVVDVLVEDLTVLALVVLEGGLLDGLRLGVSRYDVLVAQVRMDDHLVEDAHTDASKGSPRRPSESSYNARPAVPR